MLPKEPMLLLSVVNTKLRDEYESLAELCAAEGAELETIQNALAAVGCRYDEGQNRFM
ncbi:MAG: DUF4250 domain-containing protein [Oscillospiraceae bacterium]|nr:DUF4250 domain-containing protein [Oscillospiraceae bacterium]